MAALKVKSRLEISDPTGAACVVKLLDRDAQGIRVSVSGDSVSCGPRGRQFRIQSASIQDVAPYRESKTARRRSGVKVAGASAAVITAGVAVGLGTGKGAAGLAIVAGGLTALTIHLMRQDIRYSVRIDRIP